MNHQLRKLGFRALVMVSVLVFCFLDLRVTQDIVEADMATPGGISAMPSAIPGIPGVMNQGIPAIIRAKAPGNTALVSVFCDPEGEAPSAVIVGRPCASTEGDFSRPITFEITRVYPPEGTPASTFAATGTSQLTCISSGPFSVGGGPCDYNDARGVVVVQVNGGGVNEIVRVTATDAIGESRSVDIVVVDTILAWGPTGQLSTAAQHEPAFISYACDILGRGPLSSPAAYAESTLIFDGGAPRPPFASDGVAGLDDLWELFYGTGYFDGNPQNPTGVSGLFLGRLNNNITDDIDLPMWWCGGDTGGLFDDFVDFETDKGTFSVDPVATSIQTSGLVEPGPLHLPLTLDPDCGEGKEIDTFDIDALAVFAGLISDIWPFEGGCDADFARNGVVTTSILGNGEVGVATITAQQGGGVSPQRTINLTFVGEAALSVFIEAPENIGASGGEFKVAVVDQDGRPVGDETVGCTVEPVGGALVVVPQTGTTSSVHSEDPGTLTMNLVPTGASVVAGEELTLNCALDRDRSVSATTAIPLSTTPGVEMVELPVGCFLVGSTWDDGTHITTVAGAVAPAEALDTMWAFDVTTGIWVGFSPDAPAGVSDLTSVDRLEPFFICMNEPGTVGRPVL